jgi:sensor histidine kinase YesM
MITEFINNMTFTHLLLMALIVLVSILIFSIRALMTTLFYLSRINLELLNISGAMNSVVSATEECSSNTCDVAIEVGHIHNELNKLTKKIDAS